MFNINFNLLWSFSVWDQTKCSRYRWLWYDVTTYLPYTDETSYENSLLVQQTGALALSSMSHVMKSLTTNAKQIFLLLAKHQIDNKDSSTYQGKTWHPQQYLDKLVYWVNESGYMYFDALTVKKICMDI